MSDWSFGAAPQPQTPPKRRGRGLLVAGAVLLLLGIVVSVVSGVGVARSASGLIDGFASTYATPGEIERTFEGGQTLLVYEDVGPSGESPASAVPRLSTTDVSVVGPGGYPITVVEPSAVESATYDDGDRTYAPIASFDTSVGGAYTITVSATGGDVLVTPGVGQIARAGLAVVAVGIGVLLGVVGIVLLIIGAVLAARRPAAPAAVPPYTGLSYGPGYGAGYGAAPSGADPYGAPTAYPVVPQPAADPAQQWQQATPAPTPAAPPPPQALPPAGWYPDPQRPGGRRYWDGARWTDHLA